MISFEEFKKVELKIATIKSVEDHPDADRLYVLKIAIGDEEKQIVAGIKKHYGKDELVNRQVVVVNNLEPVILRGVESQGMLLAAGDEEGLAVLTPDKAMASGSSIR